jgi:hypothetical protein
MLFFLGKDVFRWLEQCMDSVGRSPHLSGANLQPQSFARFLTASPPTDVLEKLSRWGVTDYSSIFARAIGLNTLFIHPPIFECLADHFLRNYHRYADSLFRCYLDTENHDAVDGKNFHFCLYASGEYSRLLEAEWSHDQPGEAQA